MFHKIFFIISIFLFSSIVLANSSQLSNGKVYTNKEYGFRITLTKGWVNRESGFSTIICFKRENAKPSEPLPDLRIAVIPLDPEYKNKKPIDMLSDIDLLGKENPIEQPKEFEQNGLKGARYIGENNWHRFLTIIFFGRENIYTLLFTTKKDTFEPEYKEIEDSIKSFELIAK